LFIAKQLGDLLVGLLAEQPDDDGAEVLVARPPARAKAASKDLSMSSMRGRPFQDSREYSVSPHRAVRDVSKD
jgi:hypothetical protein